MPTSTSVVVNPMRRYRPARPIESASWWSRDSIRPVRRLREVLQRRARRAPSGRRTVDVALDPFPGDIEFSDGETLGAAQSPPCGRIAPDEKRVDHRLRCSWRTKRVNARRTRVRRTCMTAAHDAWKTRNPSGLSGNGCRVAQNDDERPAHAHPTIRQRDHSPRHGAKSSTTPSRRSWHRHQL